MDRLLDPAILGTLIPIVALVTAGAVILGRYWMRHRERMAMIDMGMHPDHPEELAEGEDAEGGTRVELDAPAAPHRD